jgi:hypothetical protein
MRIVTVVFSLLLTFTAPASAQDTLLTRLLVENRHPLSIVDGHASGSGGRLLVAGGLASRFFLLGEEHGVAELPGVTSALLSELRPAGFNTFAIEVSPLQGMRLDEMARGRAATASLDTMLSSWMTAVPFYSLRQERDLLAAAMQTLGTVPAMRIWGLDYEVSADRHYLRELEQLAPSSGRAIVRAARELADSGFSLLATQGNPSQMFAWTAPDSVFAALRQAFGANPPERATTIIDLFERTARINRLFLSGAGYESNLQRAGLLRHHFAAALARAEGEGEYPRVFFKFGGAHMMRGLTYVHTLDLGAAAAITAEARREESFHVLVIGGPASRTAQMNIVKAQYEPTGTAEIDGVEYAWLRPALPDSGWAVFDMRPVRRAYLSRPRSSLTPMQDRFFHAFDVIVVLMGSTPAEPMPLRTDR